MSHTRIAALRTQDEFLAHLAKLDISLPFDANVASGVDSPLAQPLDTGIKVVGNRFTVLPMEGWDGDADGNPSDLTLRRWTRFGASGAKLIWGGEAVAVRHDGRASPNQVVASERTLPGLVRLREALVAEHRAQFGGADDLLIGLQLTHSGRFSKPNDKKRLEPRTAYRHPWLDKKFNAPDDAVFSDDEISLLIEDFGRAAAIAQRAGFEFVDLKHCHGYLGHELLSAHDRPGKFGGSFENRTRFLRDLVDVVRTAAPGMGMGVRLSAVDLMPFKPGPDKIGEPDFVTASVSSGGYPYAFGGDGSGLGFDTSEPKRFLDLVAALGIKLVCITLGSPYYNPHIQRPALFPPSDGYLPPEDPLCGVARQIRITAELKRHRPDLVIVGTGYSYLQEWLPNVAQAVLRAGAADSIGLGRMVLSYPELAADVIAGRELQRKRICRTFSDCTTGPRNGLVSGCYPLDDFYKQHPHRELLDAAKKAQA